MKLFLKLLLLAAALGLSFALTLGVTKNMPARQENVTQTVPLPQIVKDFNAAKAQNEETAAWIDVPYICYEPVMFRDKEDGNAYYLTHTYQNTEDQFGALFLNRYTPKTLFQGDAALIHGHNYNGRTTKVKSHEMFGDLVYYKEESFFKKSEQNPIRVFDGKILHSYRPFAVFLIEDGIAEQAVQMQWENKEAKKAYLQSCYEKSLVKLWEPEDTAKILFLSTCDFSRNYPNPYSYEDPRLIVGAYEIQTEVYK